MEHTLLSDAEMVKKRMLAGVNVSGHKRWYDGAVGADGKIVSRGDVIQAFANVVGAYVTQRVHNDRTTPIIESIREYKAVRFCYAGDTADFDAQVNKRVECQWICDSLRV